MITSAPQLLYQIETSHLDSLTPSLRGFPHSTGAWVRLWGVDRYHLEASSSNSSDQERAASFICQALKGFYKYKDLDCV